MAEWTAQAADECEWEHIRQSAKKSQARGGDKTLHILIGNLVLLGEHPEGWNKIQDNYKSELFVVVAPHNDPNVYVIQSLNKKGPKRTVNRWQLFDLKKSQEDQITADPSIKGSKCEPKLKKKCQIPNPYGTMSKTKVLPVSAQSVETDTQSE